MRRHAKAIVAISALLLLTFVFSSTFARATAPLVSIDPPSAVTYTSVHISGEVDPEDSNAYYAFETSSDGGASWSGSFQGPIAPGSGSQNVEADLTGLKPGTPYLVRLVGNNFEDPATVSAEESFTTDPVGDPTVSITAPSAITGTTAHLSGTINPQAPEAAPVSVAVEAGFKVDWHFECNPACPGLEGTIDADNSDHQVEADLTGLEPGATYEVSLVATNAGAQASAGPESFSTQTIAPEIKGVAVSPLSTEATLEAAINPGGLKTTFHVEYGPDASYGSSTAERTIAAGGAPVKVRVNLVGLTRQTGYHLRVVAANSVGGAVSPDQGFITQALPGPDNCPNAAIRAQQRSAFLPDCRAYEMVSPADKNGGSGPTVSPGAIKAGVQAAAGGDGVLYGALSAFGDSQGTGRGGIAAYRASRQSSGWASSGANIRDSTPDPAGEFALGEVNAGSADLTKTLVTARTNPITGVSGHFAAWIHDVLTGTWTELTQEPAPGGQGWDTGGPFAEKIFLIQAVTPDLSTAIVQTRVELTPDAVPLPNEAIKLYRWHQGTIELASVIPDRDPSAPAGSEVPTGVEEVQDRSKYFRLSAEGNVFYFVAAGGVYRRDFESHTTELIAPSNVNGQGPNFLGASRDGDRAFLSTDNEEAAGELLMYEHHRPVGERLVQLSVGAPGEGFPAGLMTSADGHRVYFTSRANLVSGAPPLNGAGGVFLWDDADGSPALSYLGPAGGESYAASPSGRFFAVETSSSALTSDDNGGRNQIYVYDAESSSPTIPHWSCASCDPSGSTGVAAQFRDSRAAMSLELVRTRQVLNDGSVFFQTAEPLASADSNGETDVYRFKADSVDLISTGKSGARSLFADASEDGSSIFFVTTQSLVAADRDNVGDLYVARTGGGFAEDPDAAPVPCQGEECQSSSSDPVPASAGSAHYVGPGDASNRRKHRHQKKKHRSCVKRRVPPNASGAAAVVPSNRHSKPCKGGRS